MSTPGSSGALAICRQEESVLALPAFIVVHPIWFQGIRRDGKVEAASCLARSANQVDMGVDERVPVSWVEPEEPCDDEHASVSPLSVVRIAQTDVSCPFER